MVEFSGREKIIILITTYINHPATKTVPDNILRFGLKSMCLAKNITVSDLEVQEFMDAIKNEQVNTIKEGFGFLGKHT